MGKSALGTLYNDGDAIVSEGEPGDSMYVIQSGTVVLHRHKEGKEVFLAELGERDFFGEMTIFEREARSATVRAKGEVHVLTVDKKTLLSRIQKDPSLAFRLLEKMSSRIRKMDAHLTRIKGSDRRNWDTRPETFDGFGS